ncbi:glycosyl hydrolase family 95 catalytic domain-containing protein [Cohnella luojiensis]|uniref:Glycoside hydrolase family 95 protein n=1 Tax=Cohnella luojiensis TaxID=652876 RepID=A0A4Y8LX51_9BACL|nr:glycoside hydrolase family 95 protein [Cohnella luojiensis]TFE26647.1 glycoside hydrolase family 95 protein [Cohnella luojiensis]
MDGMKLRYSRPAMNWSEGLPIGNGRLGAVIQGGIESEIWSMTEVTYWSGQPEEIESTSQGKADLKRMRELFFAGDYRQGEKLAQQVLEPTKKNFGTNLTLCDVKLRFNDEQGEQFGRELNLEDAIVYHSYKVNGKSRTREVFSSHADGIVVSRIRSEQSGGLSFVLGLEGRTPHFTTTVSDDGTIEFAGQATEDMHSDGSCGVLSRGRVKVVARGGTVVGEAGSIAVKNADEAIIYFAVATEYGRSGEDWTRESARQLEQAISKGYERLREDHVADYRKLYSRVSLELGSSVRSELPTDERIRMLMDGQGEDPQLFALFYQYGRYLMIAGSREDSPLPMNLQGIWNDGEANRMQWSCDYHLDVNTEMNYYPAETGNLAECHVPLMAFVEKLSVAGKSAAKAFYGCEGWVAHVFTNAWGFASPGWGYSWGMNVTGGLWLATHLREHYEFGLDSEFLRKTAYPVMKEAAAFFLDYMSVHPKYGWLVTGPSNSPENSFYIGEEESEVHHLSMGSTMDQMLVRDLFEFCLTSAEALDTDPEFREKLKQSISLLPPLQIGKRGQLQEWLEDYGEAQPDHRHLSHLFGLYPGNQVTPRGTPDLSAAARTTLENRMGRSDLEDVEFTLAMIAASFARLKDGANAHKQLTYLIGRLCFDNLFTFSKAGIAGAETNIFVADGNFGGTAAIAEMLLQSHAGEIDLLPALPEQWKTGEVTGLRAKGNAEVDIAWKNGSLIEARIKAYADGQTSLRHGKQTVHLDLEQGRVYKIDSQLRIV